MISDFTRGEPGVLSRIKGAAKHKIEPVIRALLTGIGVPHDYEDASATTAVRALGKK